MRRVLTLVHKDILIFLKDRVAIALGFVVPLVMILVFGLVFGRSGTDPIEELRVLAVSQDTGPAGTRLLRSVDELDEIRIVKTVGRDSILLDSITARKRVAQGDASAALIIPSTFTESLLEGKVCIYLLEDPHDPITAGVLAGLLQQQVFSEFPGVLPMNLMSMNYGDSVQSRLFSEDLRRIVEKNFGGTSPDTTPLRGLFPREFVLGTLDSGGAGGGGFSMDSAFAQAIDIRREAVVGQKIANPGIAQSVAGPAVMFMLFGVGAIAASLLREMRAGIVQRALLSGVKPGELLFSKYVYALLMGSVQLTVMMVYGWLIFELEVFAHLGALPVVILFSSAAMSGIGLITAALSKTEEQAAGLQVVVILGMSAIGGAMFPSFMIPEFVRSLASFTPVHWAMQAFLDVFWRNQSLAGVMQECAVLFCMAALTIVAAVLIFRRRLAGEFA